MSEACKATLCTMDSSSPGRSSRWSGHRHQTSGGGIPISSQGRIMDFARATVDHSLLERKTAPFKMKNVIPTSLS